MHTQAFASPEEALAHYGIKGMKWGVRRSQSELDRLASRRPEGVSRKVNRDAKRDAEEFTRARMFYGQGAGTRRKLIKAKVETKSKRDPSYKKAFDQHISNTDMSKRSTQATRERKRKDVVSGTTKTARGVHRSLTGGFGTVSMYSAVVAAGIVAAKKSGADKIIMNAAKTQYATAKDSYNTRQAQDILRKAGFKV